MTDIKPKHKLLDMKITEVSGVDKAANQRRFLLVKRAGGDEGGGEVVSNEAAVPAADRSSGLLARAMAGLAALFKADGQTFAENMAQEQINDRFYDATYALRQAISNTLQSTDLDAAAKVTSIGTSLAQFQEFILGLVSSATGATFKSDELLALAKAGAKMSAARKEKLQAAYETIGEILEDVTQADDGDKNSVGKGDGDVSNEQLEAITKRLDETGEALKKLDALQELTKQVKALEEQNTNLVKRIEELEKTPGTKKSADGQDPDPNKKESFWKGIF